MGHPRDQALEDALGIKIGDAQTAAMRTVADVLPGVEALVGA